MNSIFSTYTQGENRVTSTIIAVFQRLHINTLNELLDFLLRNEEDDNILELVKFSNQPRYQKSIPDAEIKSSFHYLFETKKQVNSVDVNQLKNHLSVLTNKNIIDSRLILITPDSDAPAVLSDASLKNEPIYWFNFASLLAGIADILTNYRFLMDIEQYLLEELKSFIENTVGLLPEDISKRVLIIPAGKFAKTHGEHYYAYICQANRSFQPSAYLAYYLSGAIDTNVPKILGYVNSFHLLNDNPNTINIEVVDPTVSMGYLQQRLADLQQQVTNEKWENVDYHKIFLLSKSIEEGTIILKSLIKNDKKDSSNKNTAFLQKQRYTNIDRLQKAKTTTDLEQLN